MSTSSSPATPSPSPFSSRWHAAGLVTALVGLTILLTWPLALHLGRGLPGNLGDPLLNATILGWNVQWLTGTRVGEFWDAPIFHPHDNTLAYSEHLIGQTLFVWPVFAATGNGLLAYNLALLLAFVVCGVASYLWLHDLTGRRDVALLFALAVTFTPYRMGAQLTRLQMLSIGWLPLALWALHRYEREPRVRYLAWSVIGLTLLVLSNMYMLFLAAFPVAVLMGAAVWRARGRRWRTAAAMALVGAITTVLLVPTLVPYRKVHDEIGLEHADDHTAAYSAHLSSYVSIHTSSPPLPWLTAERTGDQALYPGLVLGLSTLLAATVAWRRRQHDALRSAWPYVLIAAGAFCLSFGPDVRTADGTTLFSSPFFWLRDHLPGFSAVRAPSRFAAVLFFALAALGALAWTRLTTAASANVRAVLFAGAVGVIVLEAWPLALRIEAVSPLGREVDRELYAWLATHPPGAMLELPGSPLTAQAVHTETLFQFATLHHPHRLVNGYSGFNAPIAQLLEGHESPFRSPDRVAAGLDMLRSHEVRWVVVHPHDYANPALVTDLVGEMRKSADVQAEHRIGEHHVFELHTTRGR